MKVVLISDTHGLHHQLVMPKGDILIHTGDVSERGTATEIKDFLDWFSAQNYRYKIFIAGNHDFYFEQKTIIKIKKIIPPNIYYLNDEILEIEGLKIWGSPITPIPTRRWAFNRNRGEDIQKKWNLIPCGLDILMVHGPAKGVLDYTIKKENVGCQNLLKTIEKQRPKMVVFGHIHEARGQKVVNGIHFVNASSVDRYKTKVFAPFVFEI